LTDAEAAGFQLITVCDQLADLAAFKNGKGVFHAVLNSMPAIQWRAS
jgi:hypothetical protein